MKNEDVLVLSKEQKEVASEALKAYFDENFELAIGGLQATLLLDFITQYLGKFYYNNGIMDAYAAMQEKLEDLYLLLKEEH